MKKRGTGAIFDAIDPMGTVLLNLVWTKTLRFSKPALNRE
jgi:hypothetical protein